MADVLVVVMMLVVKHDGVSAPWTCVIVKHASSFVFVSGAGDGVDDASKEDDDDDANNNNNARQ